jgi:ribokinase
MKPHIVVIGSTNTDMIIKVPHLPAPGETILGGKFSVAQGGKGANQAVAAARAGGSITFISCIGKDLFGKKSLEELSKEGIDISKVKMVDGVSSGVALINVSMTGENSISVAPGANSQLFPEDIERVAEVIKTADLVLLQLEIPLDTVKRAVEIAFKEKVPVMLNPAPGRLLDPELLAMVDVLTPNENEASLISESSLINDDYGALTDALLIRGSKTVVMTLGKKGAFFSKEGLKEHIPGFQVNAVDTTGAGDTFNGYLAVALAKGDDLKCAVTLANRAASQSVTRLGAQPSIPKASELDSLAGVASG